MPFHQQNLLFRQYRSDLLENMISEGNFVVYVENVDEEKTTRTGMSVLQENKSVDCEQKGNMDGNDDEGQENRVGTDDNAKTRIHSTQENELNAIDNHFWLASAAKPQIAKRSTETRRLLPSDTSINGILDHVKRGDGGHLSANPSLSRVSPATRLPPDLEEVAMHRVSLNRNIESARSQLTPELRELAQIAAKCLYERLAGRGRGVPRSLIKDGIATFGSERLKQLWQKKSKLPSFAQTGLIGAVPFTKRTVFRLYRSELLAKMLSEGNVAVDVENVELERTIRIGMTVLTSQLTPELRELAQIAAECLYERPAGRGRGLRRDVIDERIAKFGSKELKQLWQKKSKLPSFVHQGYYTDAVPSTKRVLFRQYRSQLLANMFSEGNTAVDVKNVDEERTIHTGMSVFQEKKYVDREQKGNMDGNDDEGQENRVGTDDNTKTRIHSTQENELNAIDNHLWLTPAAKKQIGKRVAETRRTQSDTSVDGILNQGKSEDHGRRYANQSLADGFPAMRLPSDLHELARLLAECMDANSNEICQETLALRVLSSECQMLKDRWNGMARLSRFQRDGYSMLIPRCMRKAFQIHLKSIMNNGIKGQSVETSVGNQTSTITCHSTKGPPFVVPYPQKKPNQLAGAATITALRVPRKYQEAEDLDNEVQGEDMSGDRFTDSFPADDERVLEAAEAAARKRCSEAFSKGRRMYTRSEDESATKRLKTAPETVLSKHF
jgi:ABC-type Zn2+ transport system substrate-binding protein/surface adhesin